MNLYNIKQEYLDILNQLEELEGEITPEIEQALIINQKDLQEKAVGYGFIIKRLDDDVSIIDAEIKRLQEYKKKSEARKELLEQRISEAMKLYNIEKVETPTLKLSFRKSESVEIEDENQVPKEYIKIKTTTSIDKVALKAAIKEGKVIAGATLIKKDNLQIK